VSRRSEKNGKARAIRPVRIPRQRRGGTAAGAPRLRPEDVAAAFQAAPLASALLEGDVILNANDAFARALGLDPSSCVGRRVTELLPPQDGLQFPEPGVTSSYRARLGGFPARVDMQAVAPRRNARGSLVVLVLSPKLEEADTAANRALLTLSREVAAARSEEELAGAQARALEVLFPGRSFCIRLVDPRTLALTTLYAQGRLMAPARDRIALRRAAVRKTGLSEAALEAGGIEVVDGDLPIFEGCERTTAVPLTVGGALFGVLNLEYQAGAPGDPDSDEPLLLQVANQVALGVRNLRSIEELTFLKTYLEDLIENANALIVVVNREGSILVFNRALSRLTAWSREEALGEALLSLVPESERDRMDRVLARSLEGEPVTSFETRIMLRRGGEAQVVFNTAPIAGSDGTVEGIIAIGQDLTALRMMEERAEHYQKLASFGRLAAGIVHELNNPLTSIVTYSDALLLKYRLGGLDPADQEKLRRVKEAGERIQKFSRDLITYARPSADKMERVDLAEVMDQAAHMCEPALRQARARVTRRLDPVPRIWGVPGSLLQVFVNLITNAAQAIDGEGGTVTLGLISARESVSAQVTDDGSGMPPEVKSRIFEPFFTTKSGSGGTGLGLSIVQGIVARHEGKISVESLPGKGTTVTVVLPQNAPNI
jgi:PAS domain S-box-containing protein